MKNFILTLLAAFCVISANAQNEFKVLPAVVEKGSKEVTLEVYLKNDFEAVALTYFVTTPEGFHVKKNKKGLYALNTSYAYVGEGDITWEAAPVQIDEVDGKERFGIAAATGSDYIAAQEGVIMKIFYEVDETVKAGVYNVDVLCSLICNDDKSGMIKDAASTTTITVEGTDAIANVETLSSKSVYDLQGRRTNAKNGVLLVNGQKQIVK